MENVSYEEFSKMELRIGKIIEVEEHPKAVKLLVLKVSFGDEERTIVAGLKKHYSLDYLRGKKAVFITNLEPIVLRGIESQGMLLAAVSEDDSEVIFLTPEKDIGEGSKIR